MIEGLTEQREKHKQSCIDNNDNSHEIIADLYSDPTHFIFEIIQNAEDTKAQYVNFNLLDDNLIIEHNGDAFTYSDIDSITTVGNSTKKDDINKIGKFGAGFKSVFAVTNTPKIHSGKYHFEIKDFIIPIEINRIALENNITKIILPLKNKEVQEKISEKLQNLEMETLLFLNNINEIKYQTNSANGHYIKDDDNLIKNNNDFGNVFIISEKNKDEQNKEYFIINDHVIIDDKSLKISVAYILENNKIVKSDNSKLSVFFPTAIDTNLNFLLQAPYRTTPNRETIPFENEQNQILTKRLSKLVAESLDIIKQEKLLDVGFLELLPIEKFERNNFYMEIYHIVKEAIKTNAYIPTNTNSFDSVDNLLFSRVEELSLLLNSNDLNFIWNKNSWVNTNITYDKNRKLRDYIVNDLDIEEITFEKFARTLSADFLKQKNDNWLVDFYSIWTNRESAFNKNLKDKPIIKLEDNNFASLYDENNRLQVYKPTKDKSEFKIVKKIFIENEKSKVFFENYGVTYPDKFSELKEFIYPKYQSEDINISFDEYEKDVEKITNIYDRREKEEKKNEIINLFKDSYIVYSSNKTFKKPQDIYLPTDDLKLWFSNSENIDFVNKQIYNDNTRDLFDLLGCLKIPKRIKFKPNFSYSEKQELRKIRRYHRGNGCSTERELSDYMIEGLNINIQNINIQNSVLLWSYLLDYDKIYSTWQQKFYEGIYKWMYYDPVAQVFEASFIKLLKSTKWLYDKENNLVDTTDITIDELNDLYKKDDEKIEVLERLFEFKLDKIKELEEKTGGKFRTAKEEKELEEKLKKLNEYEKNDNENLELNNDEWEEKINPKDINIDDIEILTNDTTIETNDLSNQLKDDNPTEETNTKEDDFDKNPKQPKVSKKTKDAIGNWGEKFAYKILQNKYSKDNGFIVKWGNQNNNISKGYDFVILKNNEEVLYIEVKSKVDEKPQLISITGTQWEWARKLYNQKQGEKYQIYVVSNVNTENPKLRIITNPTKEWKDGKLKAHPVNFEL